MNKDQKHNLSSYYNTIAYYVCFKMNEDECNANNISWFHGNRYYMTIKQGADLFFIYTGRWFVLTLHQFMSYLGEITNRFGKLCSKV